MAYLKFSESVLTIFPGAAAIVGTIELMVSVIDEI